MRHNRLLTDFIGIVDLRIFAGSFFVWFFGCEVRGPFLGKAHRPAAMALTENGQ